MPPLNDHLKGSMDRTGKDYRDLHEWIDNDPSMEVKIDRHSLNSLSKNVQYVRSVWGDEGVTEFIKHVVEDMESRMGEVFRYFGLCPAV